MLNKFLSLIQKCGIDVDCYESEGIFHVTFQDFLGFNDNWEEEMRYYDNPAEVEYLENWLEENCNKKEEKLYTTYFFENFTVKTGYASYDI